MLRVASSIITARSLLQRWPRTELHIIPIKRSLASYNKDYPPQEREPCLQPPPKPPPPKEDAWVWGTLTLLILSGGLIVYAKNNPELRDWFTLHAPWFDEIIAIVYQESMTYQEFGEKCVKNTKKAINNLMTPPPKQCTDVGTPKKIEKPVVEEDARCLDEKEEKKEPPATPVVPMDICEVETCLKDMGDSAIFNYMTARDECAFYNKQVLETMDKFSLKKLMELNKYSEERKEMVKKYTGQAKCAATKLEELSKFVESGIQAPKEQIKNTRDLLKEYKSKIKTIQIQYELENSKSEAMEEQTAIVKEMVDKYITENSMMMKDLDYMARFPTLKGDPDLLLHHTSRYVTSLRQEVKEASKALTNRIDRAVEEMMSEVDDKKKKELEAQIQSTYKKMSADVEREYQKRASKTEMDNEMKAAIKKHLEKSKKTLAARLEMRTQEANSKLKKIVAAKVEQEKKEMAKQKATMAEKLADLEEKLEARLKAERDARRSQDLWCAGFSLLNATRKGEPYVCVTKEIKAIERASGDGDPLVLSVLKAIPDSVKKRGVVPESVIRRKYHAMEDVAMKVALVEQEGGPLPVFILSFIQSLFLFMKIPGIPQNEFDNPPKEPCKHLDTFDLLQRARFYIERGDIATALKYVSALEGASKAAAEGWYKAARSHLETRQAAEAVLAHATALGLQYI